MEVADRLLDRLRLSLFTLLPVVLVIASIGGWWLSRRALQPVDNLTQAARSISLEKLSHRLDVPQTGDELQRLAETWNSMLSRLEESVTRLTRFAADASHELRTPLALIRTTAELAARRDRSPEDYRQALLGIVAESARMTALLDDLLLFARVDAGSVELPKSTVDLSALVNQVCSQIQPMAEAKSLSVKFTPAAESMHLTANEPAIRRLVLVLLDNAVKYSKSGGQITVSLHPEATTLNLEISDNGPGIQHDHLPHIFERFYRSPDARQTNPDGSGLGLSLAAAIAQRHNAEINVTSRSESGSTFRVLFNH
jgi:heavy metal sensor kinase